MGSVVMEVTRANAFFVYAVALTLIFTLFAIWRLKRRKAERALETREEFLAYPQTSPEIYAWLPYHKEELDAGVEAPRSASSPSSVPQPCVPGPLAAPASPAEGS